MKQNTILFYMYCALLTLSIFSAANILAEEIEGGCVWGCTNTNGRIVEPPPAPPPPAVKTEAMKLFESGRNYEKQKNWMYAIDFYIRALAHNPHYILENKIRSALKSAKSQLAKSQQAEELRLAEELQKKNIAHLQREEVTRVWKEKQEFEDAKRDIAEILKPLSNSRNSTNNVDSGGYLDINPNTHKQQNPKKESKLPLVLPLVTRTPAVPW